MPRRKPKKSQRSKRLPPKVATAFALKRRLPKRLRGKITPGVKDFVRCDDPACKINKGWVRRRKQFPDDGIKQPPHCHLVY